MVNNLTRKEKINFDKLAKLSLDRFQKWHKIADEVLTYYSYACSRCGRCCRGTTTQFTDDELAAMIKFTGTKPMEFVEKNTYLLDEGVNRMKRPCPLLTGNECSVYPVRPSTCRRYPLNFPFMLYDVNNCSLSAKIWDDMKKITPSEFSDGLDPLEKDEDLMKKIKLLGGMDPNEDGVNARHILNEEIRKNSLEDMPVIKDDIEVLNMSYSPVHFNVLLMKKRIENGV